MLMERQANRDMIPSLKPAPVVSILKPHSVHCLVQTYFISWIEYTKILC